MARRPALRFAYPFAAGAAVTTVVLALITGGFSGRTREELPVAGTMHMASPGRGGIPVDRQELVVEGAAFVFETRAAEGRVRLQVGFPSALAAEVLLSFDSGSLEPVGIDWPPGGRGRFDTAPGQILLRLEGKGTCVVHFTAAAGGDVPLHVTARAGGQAARAVLHTRASAGR